MATCKRCNSENTVKNGAVRGKPRYKCNDCGYNFVNGDGRMKDSVVAFDAVEKLRQQGFT